MKIPTFSDLYHYFFPRSLPLPSEESLAFAKFKEVQGILSELQKNYPNEKLRDVHKFSFLSEKSLELVTLFYQTTFFQKQESTRRIPFEKLRHLSEEEVVQELFFPQKSNSFFTMIATSFKDFSDPLVIPLSEDDPFRGSDLVVFQNEVAGNLPVNGIREKAFSEVKMLYSRIADNETVLFSEIENSLFHIRILETFQRLLARDTGRRLLSSILYPGITETLKKYFLFRPRRMLIRIIPSVIMQKTFSVRETDDSCLSFQIHLKMNEEKHFVMTSKPELEHTPLFIRLAHELLKIHHLMRYRDFRARDPEEIRHYKNALEKVVLTGKLNGRKEELYENLIRKEFSLKNGIYA